MSEIMSLGLWIKRRRKALDLTQEELAQRVGCSLELIRKIEADARRPSREVAARLADQLELASEEQAAFIHAARAELSADRLAPPLQSIARGGFTPPSIVAEPPPTAALPAQALPGGTVTFLFTDIAGSTRLWELYPQAMPAALARHDALLGTTVASHGGQVFKTVGDSVLAAFATAPAALNAALAAQRACANEPWELPEPLQVRMAIHTGAAEPRAGDYFGPALNRTARLLAAGHGGQVLLSLAAEELVREQLPPGAALADLGTHRLRDLSLPERIYQLEAPDLLRTFPPLNTLDTRQTNLPAQPTALVGREQELAALGALLRNADTRLVTLTGPGGVGKTRLGVQAAADQVEDFQHGVYFVDLAPVREPDLAIGAIAHTLGVREAGGQTLLAALKGYLRDKHMLLLLDNFEQILDAAPLVAELLAAAPQLKILATSREPLRLRGEHEFSVPPLALPPTAVGTFERSNVPTFNAELTQYEAVQLFIARARAAKHDFEITNANAPAVAEICARLDGLPLAIELAAARVKIFPPETLLARLSSRLALLTGGPRDLPARQQALRNTIAWSYDLLNPTEQALFRRLGVFVGGCTLEAAETVIALNVQTFERSNVLDGLAALVDKSLLRRAEAPDGSARFTMLETIREYALERLDASGEARQLRLQHAQYYLALVAAEVPDESEDPAQFERIDREYDNLSSALAWSLTTAGDSQLALQLACALTGLWYHRGVRREAIAALERAIAHPLGVEPTATLVFVRLELAQLLALTGKYAEARAQFELARPLVREQLNRRYYGWVLERLGWVAREQGDSATARVHLAEGLALFREQNNALEIAETLNTLAEVAILDEDPAEAEALLEESLSVGRRVEHNAVITAWALNHLGHAAELRGDYERAERLHQESAAIFPSDYHAAFPLVHLGLGASALGLGRLDDAAREQCEGLRISWKLSDQISMSWHLAALGTLAAHSGKPERAARLWGAAEQLRQAIGCRRAPAARAAYERALSLARAQIGEAAFAAAWAAGQALPIDQAIAEALE